MSFQNNQNEPININQISEKNENLKQEINHTDNEKGQYENLKFNSKLILDVNEIQPRKDSESPQIKFSIDLPNAPKQRLHEYLNNDLLNALDNNLSNPSTPLVNPNNSLQNPQLTNINNIPQISLNDDSNKIQFQNTNINNNINTNNMFNQQLQMNLLNHKNLLNHITGNNKIQQQHMKEKGKKPFEIREGDWTCFYCNNLNFAFRTKCNRCGLAKEDSIKKYNMKMLQNMYNNQQNIINSNNGGMYFPSMMK
jgi:hypothetical protein